MGINLSPGLQFTLPGLAVCSAQVDHYPPFFTVDITDLADPATDLANTTGGEAMDVNNDGFAVGWFSTATTELLFFMSPIDGGSAIELPLGTGFTIGHAIGISETTGYDLTDAVIVGWAERISVGPNGHEPVYWTRNGTDWVFNLVPFLSAVVGETQAVTDSGQIAGFFLNAQSEERIFTYDLLTEIPAEPSNTRALALAARDDATGPVISGVYLTAQSTLHGFYLKNSVGEDLHTSLVTNFPQEGYTDSRALGMSSSDGNSDDIVGFGSVGANGTDAVYWWRETTSAAWKVALLNISNPDPIDAAGTAINDRDANGWVDLVGDYQPVSGDRGAFYVTMARNAQGGVDYWSFKLDATAGVPDPHPSLTMFPLKARLGTGTPRTWTGNGINNTSAIAGSYKPDDSQGDYLPCLFVPNDFDNNGIPDIREILHGTAADDNNNWIIDWAENDQGVSGAENIRGGLHAPGTDGTTSGTHMLLVENVQIVRFPAPIAALPVGIMNVDDDLYGLEDIVAGNIQAGTGISACEDFLNRMTEWGTSDGNGGAQQREIIMTVTNPHQFNPNFDEALRPEDQFYQERLDIVRTFAFRFANCIDYMQFGNESLKGSSEWGVGDATGVTALFELENSAFTDALLDGVDWVQDQAETARIGSALAGRPLRVITPGFPIGVINTGALGDPDGTFDNTTTGAENKSARGMRDIGALSRSDQMFFDVHLHYKTVLQANDGLTNMQDDTLAAWDGGASLPGLKVMLEFSPKGDKSKPFWNGSDGFNATVDKFFDKDGSPRFATWDLMLKSDDLNNLGWEKTQYLDAGNGDGFHMADVLGSIDANEYTAVCYGPSIQGSKAANTFLIASLRANRVKNKGSWNCDSTDQFGPMLKHTCLPNTDLDDGDDGFEEIIGLGVLNFVIQNFTPHCSGCNGCDLNITCPPQ